MKSKKEILEKLDILLSNAVETQMISDVPLGVLLSGGVDSSLIATYAAQKVDNLKTFNITFNEHKDLNESEYAKKLRIIWDHNISNWMLVMSIST